MASVIASTDVSVSATSTWSSSSASSTAIIQSGRDVPATETFWPTFVTRPSRFVVVPDFSPYAAAASTTSAAAVESVRNVSTAMIAAGAGEGPAGEVGVGEVVERVGAEQHEQVDAPVGGGGEDAGGVEAAGLRA